MLCKGLRNAVSQTLLSCLLFPPHCLNIYPSYLPLIPSSFLPFIFVSPSSSPPLLMSGANIPYLSLTPPLPFLFCLSLPLECLVPLTIWPFAFSSPLPSSFSQSVIVKSVERNAVNMYEARKFLLGLESNGVSSSVVLNPAPNGPSPSLICPVGLDILASAGLGLSNLGNDTV